MIHTCLFCGGRLKNLDSVIVVSSPTRILNCVGAKIFVDESDAGFGQQIYHEECLRENLSIYDQTFRDADQAIVQHADAQIPLAELAKKLQEVLVELGVDTEESEVRQFVMKTPLRGEGNPVEELVCRWFKRQKGLV